MVFSGSTSCTPFSITFRLRQEWEESQAHYSGREIQLWDPREPQIYRVRPKEDIGNSTYKQVGDATCTFVAVPAHLQRTVVPIVGLPCPPC